MTTKPETETPFAVGARVSVIRTTRGWYDGKLTATVKKAYLRDGETSYYYIVKDDGGKDHKVNHTRDMRAFQNGQSA